MMGGVPVWCGAVNLDPQELPHLVVGACMEVHRHLGAGMPCGVYRDCLAQELRMKEILFRRDVSAAYLYKGMRVEPGVVIEFLVEEMLLVSVVSADAGDGPSMERLRSLLRLTGYEVGLLVNFNVAHLREGVRRIIVAAEPPALHYRQDPGAVVPTAPV